MNLVQFYSTSSFVELCVIPKYLNTVKTMLVVYITYKRNFFSQIASYCTAKESCISKSVNVVGVGGRELNFLCSFLM